MCCRSRPQYRSDLGWILGVAFLGTLTRSARPAQGFTLVRCCSLPSGFFPTRPHGARARASHDGDPCMQLPSARGCYQLAPQRTLTSNPVPMPGTPRVPTAGGGAPKGAPLTAPFNRNLRIQEIGGELRRPFRVEPEAGAARPERGRARLRGSATRAATWTEKRIQPIEAASSRTGSAARVEPGCGAAALDRRPCDFSVAASPVRARGRRRSRWLRSG